MLRASYPAMLSVAEAILKNARSKKVDGAMMPTKKVISMIMDPARRAMLSVKRGEEEDKPSKPEAKRACTGGAEAKPAKTKVEPKAFLSFIRAMGVNFFAGLPNSSPLTLAQPLALAIPLVVAPWPLAPAPCPHPLPLPPPPHPIPTPHPMPCATP